MFATWVGGWISGWVGWVFTSSLPHSGQRLVGTGLTSAQQQQPLNSIEQAMSWARRMV